MFPCERCGQCCRNVGRTIFGKFLADNDGICKYLDLNTNLCTIYNSRPLECNVDKYYDLYYKGKKGREEFYSENKLICRQLQMNKV